MAKRRALFRLGASLSALFLVYSCTSPSSSSGSSFFSSVAPVSSYTPPPSFQGAYSTGAVYEIFVGSFADSNGDGVGDLKGIQNALPYLKSLGVSALWLTPIHPSPSYHKYDVKDYYSVDSSFGTLEDFVSLCAAANADGIGIMMDMVFNHASKANPWFLSAVEDCANGVTSSSSWANAFAVSLDPMASRLKGNTCNVVTASNGKSVYYVSNFSPEMPEWDLDSPLAVSTEKAIMEFWLNKGAKGFRFDGVYYFYYGNSEKDCAYCKTLYEEATAIKKDVFLVGEYWNGGQLSLNDMATSKMTFFDFPISMTSVGGALYSIRSGLARSYSVALEENEAAFLKKSEGFSLPSYFISNHDQDRWGGTLGSGDVGLKKSKLAAAATYLTPGTPFLYYGEEIGLKGKGNDPDKRLPMIWKSKASEDSARTNPPPGTTFDLTSQVTTGALEAILDSTSLTAFYKDLLAFRQATPAIQKGIYVSKTEKDSLASLLQITYEGKTSYLATNFDETVTPLSLPSSLRIQKEFAIGGTSSLTGASLALAPYSVVYLAAA